MKVLIFFSGKFPGYTAGAKRVHFYKKGLEQTGIETDVLPHNNAGKGRIAFYGYLLLLPFVVAFRFYKLRRQYDVLFIYGFSWLTHLLLAAIARLSGIKVYLEINEKYGTVYGNRFTELKLVNAVNVALTRFSYRFFDGFVVISTAIEEDMHYYVRRCGARIIKIPILIDPNFSSDAIFRPSALEPYLLHTGALSDRKDGMAEVFTAFAGACNLLNKQLHFYLTSKIAPANLLKDIENIISENSIQDNVHFLGDISEDSLLSYQKFCKLVVINKHYNEQNVYNFPTKLGEYLALGIPVITTAIGEMGHFLSDGTNAFIVPPNDVNALQNQMVYVIQHPVESNVIAENGRQTARLHFDYILHGKRLADFFSS